MDGEWLRTCWIATTALFAAYLPLPALADSHWIEAFQSSPAAYGVNAPESWQTETAERRTPIKGTLRFQLAVSAGGSALRLRLSNEMGTQALDIAAASVALATGTEGAATGPALPVTFSGARGATIPASTPLISDALPLLVKPGAQLLISLHLPDGLTLDSYGATGLWIAPGDQTHAAALQNSTVVIGRPLVSGVAVLSDHKGPVIVTLGDSITAGGRKTAAETHGWPEILSRRLIAANSHASVVNAGIAGNRLLSDGYGQAALARLDRDVLRIDGLTHVFVLEGINDIGFPGRKQFGTVQPDIRTDELIGAYRQIVARVHARGGKVIAGTLLPFKGAFYYTPAKEEARQAVNRWIRTSGVFDAVVDFDTVMRDPADPLSLNPAYDSGDHLHPNPAGETAMGEAISLELFK